MTGKLFQLLDVDGDDWGLVYTPHTFFTDSEMELAFKEYHAQLDDDDDYNADEFITFLYTRFPNGQWERVYVENISL